MRSILEEFYFGNLCPSTYNFSQYPRLESQIHILEKTEDLLSPLLEGKEKSMFLDYINAHDEYCGVLEFESFLRGFRLGSRIILELMCDDEDYLIDKES